MRRFLSDFLMVIGVLFVVGVLISIGSLAGRVQPMERKVLKDSILELTLSGIILDGQPLLDNLRKYRADERIKGILVRVNSPGGVVGPSQEIYAELKRVREELQKPVVVTTGAVAASGAYYAALAADQIVTNPGSLLGSIGVIMEFANLQELYEWAKIERYSIKTGPYKDAGSPYKPMSDAERQLFQSLIDEVHTQFKQAVMTARKLRADVVDKYSDGRVFTGETAVKLGFADQVGSYVDALRVVGELSGLGAEPEIFVPPKHGPDFWSFVSDVSEEARLTGLAEKILNLRAMGLPLYLMPGSYGFKNK